MVQRGIVASAPSGNEVDEMKFTGERYIPSVDGQIRYEHVHRYAWCLDHVRGIDILDLASGSDMARR